MWQAVRLWIMRRTRRSFAAGLAAAVRDGDTIAIRTMRRGFARVLDHEAIIDTLAHGDRLYTEAQRERRQRKTTASVGATR